MDPLAYFFTGLNIVCGIFALISAATKCFIFANTPKVKDLHGSLFLKQRESFCWPLGHSLLWQTMNSFVEILVIPTVLTNILYYTGVVNFQCQTFIFQIPYFILSNVVISVLLNIKTIARDTTEKWKWLRLSSTIATIIYALPLSFVLMITTAMGVSEHGNDCLVCGSLGPEALLTIFTVYGGTRILLKIIRLHFLLRTLSSAYG